MKVLIAEDVRVMRRALQETLEGWGYEVVAAGDGAEAWDALTAEGAPRLAVLDWMMPGLDGVEVCRLAREHQGFEVPPYILLLTAMDGTDNLVVGLDAGADDFLVKPYKPAELRARLAVGRRFVELSERLAAANRRLDAQARTDVLTGLLNRRAVFERLEEERSRALREETPFFVGILDIDHFKQVNDTYGHAAGDEVLRGVAAAASSVLRQYDLLGRVGGEEFLVMVSRTQGLAGRTLLARIRSHVAAGAVVVDGVSISVTVSLGGALWEGESVGELVARADGALYEAKRGGRDRVVIAPPGGRSAPARPADD